MWALEADAEPAVAIYLDEGASTLFELDRERLRGQIEAQLFLSPFARRLSELALHVEAGEGEAQVNLRWVATGYEARQFSCGHCTAAEFDRALQSSLQNSLQGWASLAVKDEDSATPAEAELDAKGSPEPTDEELARTLNRQMIGAIATTAIGVASVGVGTGILFVPDRARVEGEELRRQSLDTPGWILIGLGSAVASTGIVWLVSNRLQAKKLREKPSSTALRGFGRSWGASWWGQKGVQGVAFEGRF